MDWRTIDTQHPQFICASLQAIYAFSPVIFVFFSPRCFVNWRAKRKIAKIISICFTDFQSIIYWARNCFHLRDYGCSCCSEMEGRDARVCVCAQEVSRKRNRISENVDEQRSERTIQNTSCFHSNLFWILFAFYFRFFFQFFFSLALIGGVEATRFDTKSTIEADAMHPNVERRDDVRHRLKTFRNLLNEWMCQVKGMRQKRSGRREYAENRNGMEEIHITENCGRVETVKSFRIANARSHTHTTRGPSRKKNFFRLRRIAWKMYSATWDVSLAAAVAWNMWQVKLFACDKRRTTTTKKAKTNRNL